MADLRTDVTRTAERACAPELGALGLLGVGPQRYRRRLSEDISIAATIEVSKGMASVSLEVYLSIFHDAAAKIVDAGLKAKGLGFEDYAAMALDTHSLTSLMRRIGGAKSTHSAPIFYQLGGQRAAALAGEGLRLVAERYFSHASSTESLVQYFLTDSWAGGTARRVNLMALYCALGDTSNLREFVAGMTRSNSSEMEWAFRDYIMHLRKMD